MNWFNDFLFTPIILQATLTEVFTRQVYEIVDVFETTEVYDIPLANGQTSKTNIELILKHGPQELLFRRIIFVSNAEFTEREFIEFKSVVRF